MKHKYQLTIEFETDGPLLKHNKDLVQFENGLPYFVERINKKPMEEAYQYGTGKIKLKKLKND